jgi:hypothetical protein
MRIILAFILFIANSTIYSQKVKLNEKELKSSTKVNFKNRSINRADISMIRENEEIGRKLSNEIDRNPEVPYSYKGIQVKRIGKQTDNKFSADILSLSKNSKYGHIHSLHRILSKYIQVGFQYDEESADSIAFYTLYYNAIHRNEKSYFQDKYIDDVIDELDIEKVGLSQDFKEWPGGTQIVLPLEVNPLSKKIEITLDELEREVNPIIEKTKEGEKEKNKLEEIITEKKEKDQKLAKIQEEKKKEEKKKEDQKKAETSSKPKKEDSAKSSEKQTKETSVDEGKKEDLKKTDSQEGNKNTDELAKKEEEKKPEPIEEKKVETPPEVKKEIDTLKKEVKELKKENKELKKAEEEKEKKSENVIGDKILFLRMVKFEDDGHYTNELWMLDGQNEETIYRSPYTNICGKEYIVIPNVGVLVIGFDGKRPVERIHKIVLLDPDKLTQKSITKEEIFWRSQIIFKDDKIYAFEKKKDQIFLSRFNTDMTLDARSSEAINTNSEITFFNEKIFLTGKNNESDETVIRVLQRSDLKVTKTIKPLERKKK